MYQISLFKTKSILPCCNGFTGKLCRFEGKPPVRLKPKIDKLNCNCDFCDLPVGLVPPGAGLDAAVALLAQGQQLLDGVGAVRTCKMTL